MVHGPDSCVHDFRTSNRVLVSCCIGSLVTRRRVGPSWRNCWRAGCEPPLPETGVEPRNGSTDPSFVWVLGEDGRVAWR